MKKWLKVDYTILGYVNIMTSLRLVEAVRATTDQTT